MENQAVDVSGCLIEIARGALNNRGITVTIPQLLEELAKAQQAKYELYRSYFLYDKAALLEHFKTRNSVKTYSGPYYLRSILLDVDKGPNSDQATLDKARATLEFIQEEGFCEIDAVQVWHSGRGYHFDMPDVFGFKPGPKLPSVVKATLVKWFPACDPIYDGARLIRVGQTINMKSGRWKVPLTANELFNLNTDQIFELAKGPRVFVLPEADEQVQHPDKIIVPPDTTPGVLTVGGKPQPQPEPDPTGSVVTCAQKLFLKGGTEGSRHEEALRLAGVWKKQGIPEVGVVALLQAWAPSWDPREAVRLARWTFGKDAHQFRCSDRIMSQYCDSKCQFFQRKNYGNEVLTPKDLESKFVTFARTDFSETSFDLGELFHLPNTFRILPGEFIVVMGDTGVNKSTWCDNLLVKLPHMRSLIIDLEMYALLRYRRLVQIQYGMSKEEVMQYYAINDNHLSDKLAHIQVTTTAPRIEDMATLIASVNPKIVLVDVIDGIQVPGARDDNQKLGIIADQFKALAQRMGIIIIGVHHISKFAALNGALNVHSGKGSSSIEQKADRVITIEGDRRQNFRVVRSQKVRDDAMFELAGMINPDTMQFNQIEVPDGEV